MTSATAASRVRSPASNVSPSVMPRRLRLTHSPLDARADQCAAPGDLVFFGPSPGDATHVGIVVRPGEMVDAPKPGTYVRAEPFPMRIGAAWGDEKYLGAARPSAR
jgi:cell wall-associated NlpC family hydrolase